MKNFIYACSTGILLALAWPTYGFPLLLFFGMVPLLLLEFKLRTQNVKHSGWKVFGYTYLAFLIWNIITTYWIYYSTATGMVFAIIVNTLLMTSVLLVYHKIAKKINFLASVVFLTTLWISFEYLHLDWDFSWPWLNLGNGFSEYPQWIQWYEYTGTFGGTLWVWIVNILIFKTLLIYKQEEKRGLLYRGIAKVVLWIGIPLGFSYYIWTSYPAENNEDHIEALILQPNIDPYHEKYNTDDERIGQLLKEMTLKNITDNTRLIMAPETVFADGTQRINFENSPAYTTAHEIVTDYPQASFMAGISMYDIIRDKDSVQPQSNVLRPGMWFNDYNSAYVIRNNQTNQFYNKSKLVVGVENFPFQSVLKPLLGDIMIDLGGTVAMKTTQSDRAVFSIDDKQDQTAPIICYESVYGEFVNGYVKNGAQFLSIITNDAWWENTQGHKQHMSYARLRAIENRRDVARSANTGISAIINQKGEVLQQTDYGTQEVLKGEIHLNKKLTFYTQHGDYIARASLFMMIAIFLLAVLKRRKTLDL